MTSQKDNGMQYYVMNQNLNNEKDIDNRKFHRHCVHPSREQLSFDELGKVYANISRRRIVSKVHCRNIHWHSNYSSGENTYMTVPSPSGDTNSSDDVYSSVSYTTSKKIETLDVKRFQSSKGDKFGPLPSVPNKYLNIKNTNAHDIKHTSSADEDENNNKANTDDKHATNYGNRF